MRGKVLACFIALLLMITAIGLIANSAKATTITFYYGKDPTGVIRKLIDQFETETGIKVKGRELPAATDVQHQQIVSSIMTRAELDVIRIDVYWVPEFADAGWIEPLNDNFTKIEQAKFLSSPLEACTYEGKVHAVPSYTDMGVLYYRKDLLEKYTLEPPETWEELINVSKLILEAEQDPNLNGFVFHAYQYEGLTCNFLECLWSNNGDVYDEYGSVTVNSENGVEALQFMCDLIEEGVAPKAVLGMKEEDCRGTFMEGRAVFMRNWPYAWVLVQGSGSEVEGKVGIVPLPYGPRSEHGYACVGGWNYAIASQSKQKKEAWEFIKFMTNYDSQKMHVIEGGYLPTRKALYLEKDVIKERPYVKVMGEIAEYTKPRPVVPYYSIISDILQKNVQSALLGKASAQDALNAAAKEIQGIMG